MVQDSRRCFRTIWSAVARFLVASKVGKLWFPWSFKSPTRCWPVREWLGPGLECVLLMEDPLAFGLEKSFQKLKPISSGCGPNFLDSWFQIQ
jgi:hypothetical protein